MILPFVSPNCEISSNVAVVGNSSSVLRKKYGKEIDSHTDVVRFNLAPVGKFIEHVGKKSTIHVACPKFFSCIKTSNPHWNEVSKRENCKIVCIGPETKERSFLAGAPLMPASSTLHKVDIGQAYEGFYQQPSAGMWLVHNLVNLGIKPTVYGFSGIPNGTGDQELTHYWDETKKDVFSPCHNTLWERDQFIAWHDNNMINWIDR